MERSFQAKEALKQAIMIVLVRGKSAGGKDMYAYAGIPAARYEEFVRAQRSGERLKPQDYGTIVAAGEGEPSEEVKRHMTEHFGFRHDSSVISQAGEPGA